MNKYIEVEVLPVLTNLCSLSNYLQFIIKLFEEPSRKPAAQHIVFHLRCCNNVFIIISNSQYIPFLPIYGANLTFLFLSNYLLLRISQTCPSLSFFVLFFVFSLTGPYYRPVSLLRYHSLPVHFP